MKKWANTTNKNGSQRSLVGLLSHLHSLFSGKRCNGEKFAHTALAAGRVSASDGGLLALLAVRVASFAMRAHFWREI